MLYEVITGPVATELGGDYLVRSNRSFPEYGAEKPQSGFLVPLSLD